MHRAKPAARFQLALSRPPHAGIKMATKLAGESLQQQHAQRAGTQAPQRAAGARKLDLPLAEQEEPDLRFERNVVGPPVLEALQQDAVLDTGDAGGLPCITRSTALTGEAALVSAGACQHCLPEPAAA